MSRFVELKMHLAYDAEARRWFGTGDVPGLVLEDDDAATLLRRIMEAAPEMIEENVALMRARYGEIDRAMIRIVPIFDSPLELAA